MAKDPAFLFYTGDFSTGTQFMSDEQIGKYIRLLMAQHQHGRLSEKQVIFICKNNDPEVMCKFKKDDDGFFYNERLEKEINKRKAFSESRSKNKAGKTKNTSISYDNHMENKDKDIIKDNKNKDVIENVIISFTEITGKKIKLNDSRKKLINGRLSEGYDLESFKKVIKVKFEQWKDDPKYREYLTPETLFAASNFTKYHEQAELGVITPRREGATKNGMVY